MEELYNEALELVKTERKASTSFFQRRLMINYLKAVKLMDMLEERKVIGSQEGAKAREIKI